VALGLCKNDWQFIPCIALIKIDNDILKQGEDDIKSSWPLWDGLHTCYNCNYNRKQGFKAECIQKNGLSSNYFLQLKNMKLESLLIAD